MPRRIATAAELRARYRGHIARAHMPDPPAGSWCADALDSLDALEFEVDRLRASVHGMREIIARLKEHEAQPLPGQRPAASRSLPVAVSPVAGGGQGSLSRKGAR